MNIPATCGKCNQRPCDVLDDELKSSDVYMVADDMVPPDGCPLRDEEEN